MDLSAIHVSLTGNAAELGAALERLRARHQQFIERDLSLDLTRGKPAAQQLDLSSALLATVGSHDPSGTDLRNYGVLEGLPAARKLCGELLGLAPATADSRVLAGGNSSLTLMYFTVLFAHMFGLGNAPWRGLANQGTPRILCPCPGYDRHFALCQHMGLDMLPVPLTGKGPDMDIVEEAVRDRDVKGIWCVPRFSNPTGEVYDPQTVQRIAQLPNIAADNFYVFWDNAYALHAFNDTAEPLASIETAAEKAGTLDQVIQFGSTSKITFAGAGLGYMASSETTIAEFARHFAKTSIGPDKLNQQRHVDFLKDRENTEAHMRRHAEIIAPKFSAVLQALDESLSGCGMGEWSKPDGGYFVSFNTLPGLARKVVALSAEAGVKLTPAGATFPLGLDPQDRNIRLAPTFPGLQEVKDAMQVFVNCVQLASVEQALQS